MTALVKQKEKKHGSARDRLLESTIELMWSHGFTSSGVDDICAHADAAKGSFYHFFSSKNDLAVAAIQKNWESVDENVFTPIVEDPKLSGLKKLEKLTKTVCDYQKRLHSENNRVMGCPFGSLGQEMALQDEDIRKVLDEVFNAHMLKIQQMLKQAQQDGEISADFSAAKIRTKAEDIFAYLQGIQLLSKVRADLSPLNRVTKQVISIAVA